MTVNEAHEQESRRKLAPPIFVSTLKVYGCGKALEGEVMLIRRRGAEHTTKTVCEYELVL